MDRSLDRLPELLDLEQIEENTFRGVSPDEPEPGPTHADPMPAVPPPEAIERTSDRLARYFGGDIPREIGDNPVELRSVGPLSVEAEHDPSPRTTRNMVWLLRNS